MGAPCGICGGSGGKTRGEQHTRTCFRYTPGVDVLPPTKRSEPEPQTKRSSGYGSDYCSICRGPHVFKHGKA